MSSDSASSHELALASPSQIRDQIDIESLRKVGITEDVIDLLIAVACTVIDGGVASALITKGAKEVWSRIVKTKTDRMISIMTSLNKRQGKLESELGESFTDDQKIDLLLEVFKSAISEDEDEKTIFYIALLETIQSNRNQIQTIRILHNAITNLSYIELYFFVYQYHKKCYPNYHGNFQLDDETIKLRWKNYYLMKSNATPHWGPPVTSPLASILINHLPSIDELSQPHGLTIME